MQLLYFWCCGNQVPIYREVFYDIKKSAFILLMKVVFILSAKHQYFMQVQLEMCVAETNVCNFVVWTPHKTLILEIKGDIEFQDKLCTNLIKNWVDYILPELVTRNLETNCKQVLIQTMQSDKKKYCICETTVAEGEMVGCYIYVDWFHHARLRLSKLPTSKVFYCTMCEKAKKQTLDKKDE